MIDDMLITATLVFYNQEQVVEVRAQEEERKKEARYPEEKQKREARHAQMMVAYRAKGSCWYPNHTQGWLHKCCICRQAGHWAKECPLRDRPPVTAYPKCRESGHWATLYSST